MSYLSNGWSDQLQIWWILSTSPGQHVTYFSGNYNNQAGNRNMADLWEKSAKKA